jgi:hypothetical protein
MGFLFIFAMAAYDLVRLPSCSTPAVHPLQPPEATRGPQACRRLSEWFSEVDTVPQNPFSTAC